MEKNKKQELMSLLTELMSEVLKKHPTSKQDARCLWFASELYDCLYVDYFRIDDDLVKKINS